MDPYSDDNSITQSLVKKVLKGQQLQQLQLDDLQRQLSEIQVQLQPLNGLFDQLRQLNSMPIQIQQLLEMQKQIRRLMVLSGTTDDSSLLSTFDEPSTTLLVESSTPMPTLESTLEQVYSPISPPAQAPSPTSSIGSRPTKARTTTNSLGGRSIPWPRTQQVGQRKSKLSLSSISKEIVVSTIKQQMIQHVNIDFSQYGIQSTNIINRSAFIYKRLAEITYTVCNSDNELKQTLCYDRIHFQIKKRLHQQIEKKALDDMIRIDLAEDHWLVQYFTYCFFRNRRLRVKKQVPKRRTRGPRSAPRVVTAIRSSPLPPLTTLTSTSTSESPATTPAASPTRSPGAKSPRPGIVPVVISADQNDDSDGIDDMDITDN